MHDLVPALHSLLRLLEEATVCFPYKTRNEVAENTPAVTDQTNLYGKPEADPFGIHLNLHALRIARFGQEFEVRKRSSDHEQGVTSFHCLLGRLRAQQSNRSRRIGTVVGHGCSAE